MTAFRHDLAIETFEPEFAQALLGNAVMEELATGFRWLEGPVWMADWGCLLVQDLPADRTIRWDEATGASVWRQPSGYGNGQARDRQGRLVVCSHLHRNVTRREHDGSWTVLADAHEGKRLGAPNDVALHPDGSIWFTDPPYGLQKAYEGSVTEPEQPAAVYRIAPDGALRAMTRDLVGPNGITFTADGTRAYVTETGDQTHPDPDQHIHVFDVGTDGRLSNGAEFARVAPGACDGLKVDAGGWVWASAGDGVHVLDPAGHTLGRLATPRVVSNVCWGGPAWNRLFVCCWDTLFAIYLNRRGIAQPCA